MNTPINSRRQPAAFRQRFGFFLVGSLLAALCTVSQAQSQELTSGLWSLQTIEQGGEALRPDNPHRYTLVFEEDGRVSVQADCNRGAGRYLLEGQGLVLSLAFTRALCPPGSLFDAFARALEASTSFTLEGDVLSLVSPGAVMTFTAAREESDAPSPDCPGGAVLTRSGRVCGTAQDGDSVRAFLGVPYAESTAGENRWRAPVPKAPWPGTWQADAFGPICPQNGAAEGLPPQSEDCLSVNVWTSAQAGADLPVLVFIHGGAFVIDSSAARLYAPDGPHLYDGGRLAEDQNLVVVTFNYRLGALGFLAGVAGLEGNYGIMDQQLALRWVKENIAAFGGDPALVTLAGESAGAASVGLHLLAAPESAALFGAAIMQSNPFGIPFKDLFEARVLGEAYLLGQGCWFRFDQAACLRDKPVEDLLRGQAGRFLRLQLVNFGLDVILTWAPVVDGRLITEQPLAAALGGAITKPVLLGSNQDEGIIFFPADRSASLLEYNATLGVLFGQDNFRRILSRYPLEPDNRENTIRVATDFLLVCSSRAAAAAAQGRVYLYDFTHVPSFDLWSGLYPGCADRSCHGDELAFVFGSAGGEKTFSAEEARLAEAMGRYWGGFAGSGHDPNAGRGPDDPLWPLFSETGRALELAVPMRVGAADAQGARHNCDFWDGFGYELPRLHQRLETAPDPN
jgi:carboxylesterase type B/heat shock protein HslJ